MSISAPAPLSRKHDVATFTCRNAALDDWLHRRALKNQQNKASRTYVVCDDGARVVGYYALAAGAIEHAHVSGAVRRNMPEPVPAIILGRLAVDANWHGQGIGAALLKDAILRSLNVGEAIGARVLLCHAIDRDAESFYLHHGFRPAPDIPLTVMLDLAKAARILGVMSGAIA